MARSKKIEPILIHHKTEEVSRSLKYLDEKNKALEKAISALKNVFPDKITDTQALTIIKDGWEDEIKNRSGYDNGDLETILNLWGKGEHYQTTKAAVTPEVKSYVTFRSKDFILKNGKVTTTAKIIRELKEQANVYASTEKQIKALEHLKAFADGFNTIFDNGIIYVANSFMEQGKTRMEHIRPYERILSVEKDKIIPNWYYINSLKE